MKKCFKKFPDANFVVLDVEKLENGKKYEKKFENIEFVNEPKTRIFRLNDHSIFDVIQIMKSNEKVMVCMPNEEEMARLRKFLINNVEYAVFGENGKNLYLDLELGKVKNLLAQENLVNGLEINVDKWVFYGVSEKSIYKLSRTVGENIFFIRN